MFLPIIDENAAILKELGKNVLEIFNGIEKKNKISSAFTRLMLPPQETATYFMNCLLLDNWHLF